MAVPHLDTRLRLLDAAGRAVEARTAHDPEAEQRWQAEADKAREALFSLLDPTGCPHCGDQIDPDRPRLHDQCRRIPELEARRDGWDWE